MIKQYKIGMTCKKHSACDIVCAKHTETNICTYPHHYEIYNPDHSYDLVFTTYKPSLYVEDGEIQDYNDR